MPRTVDLTPPPPRPLPGTTLLLMTVEAIARRIVGGEIPSGSLLPNEAEIVEELGVSRTVVREAVRMLVAKGMVRARRRLGTEVTPVDSWSLFDRDVIDWRIRYDPDDKVLDDLADFVMAVEMIAAVRCAEDEDFDHSALDAVCRRIEHADLVDREALAAAEYAFHRCIVEGSKNQFCAHVQSVTETALGTFMSPIFLSAATQAEATGYFRAITEAIGAGDAAAARVAVERLGTLRRKNLRKVLRDLREFSIDSLEAPGVAG